MVLVNYPQRLTLDGEAVLPLASGSMKHGAINIIPEMRFPELFTNVHNNQNVATYTREGASMTSQDLHVDFVAKELLLLTNFIIEQLPDHYEAQVNSDTFLSSISSKLPNGRTTVGPWIDAPGFRKKNADRSLYQPGEHIEDLVSQTPFREEIIRELDNHQDRMARSIPQCVVSQKVHPLSDEDIKDLKSEVDERSTPVLDLDLSYEQREYEDKYASKRFRVVTAKPGGTDAIPDHDDKGEEDFVPNEFFNQVAFPGIRPTSQSIPGDNEDDDIGDADFVPKKSADQTMEPGTRRTRQSTQQTQCATENKNVEPQTFNTTKRPRESDPEKPEMPIKKSKKESASGKPGRCPKTEPSQGPQKRPRSGPKTGDKSSKDTQKRQGNAPKADNKSSKGTQKQNGNKPKPDDKSNKPTQKPHGDESNANDNKQFRVIENAHTAPAPQDSTSEKNALTPSCGIINEVFVLLPPMVHQRIKAAREEFPILNQFNIESIIKEKSELEDDILTCYHAFQDALKSGHVQSQSTPSTNTHDTTLSVGNIKELSSTKDVQSKRRINELVNLSRTACQLDIRQTKVDIETRSRRIDIMTAHLLISDWMDKTLVQEIKLVMDQQVNAMTDEWVTPVVRDVYDMVLHQREHQTFSPTRYNIVDVEPTRFAFIKRKPRYSQCTEDIRAESITIVQEIMSVWFKFTNHEDRWRTWIIDALVKSFGKQILVLHSTWRVFRCGSKHQLLQRHYRKLRPLRNNIKPFETALEAHPLAGSTEAITVLQHMYDTLKQAMTPDTESPPTEPLGPDDPRRTRYSLYKAVDAILAARQLLFRKFYNQSLAVRFGYVNKPSELQQAQINDPERYSPFREHTPSRERMKGPDGPFNENVILTIPGIFSAIIWRAISYRTPFAMSEKATFLHIDQWKQLTAQFEDESYYCNTSAYGSSDPGRRGEKQKLTGILLPHCRIP
ncbi:hypothetical protein BJ912DRAFT_1066516 [Pholiota molesta]|nr:hypothetical protein BJ912DRAFT_1066516 [Pholiota molesta]